MLLKLLLILMSGELCISTTITDTYFLGLGYNLIKGYPEGGVHSQVGVDPGIQQTKRIIEIDQIAREKLVRTDGRNTCENRTYSEVFSNGYAFQQYLLKDYITTGDDDLELRKYAFTGNQVFINKVNNMTIEEDFVTVCNRGESRYILPPFFRKLHVLNDEFAFAVCELPEKYNETEYTKFIDKWGTHVITKTETGTKTISRFSISDTKIATVLMEKHQQVAQPKQESFMGYGSTININSAMLQNLSSKDNELLRSGMSEKQITIGTSITPAPLRLTLVTITRLFDTDFWTNIEYLIESELCRSNQIDTLKVKKTNLINAFHAYVSRLPVLKQVSGNQITIPVTWPAGTYGLFATDNADNNGCPNSPDKFAPGWRRFDSEDDSNKNSWTPTIHLGESVKSTAKPTFHFCIKTTSDVGQYSRAWPKGNYCILDYNSCPLGFTSGMIHWDDEDHDNANEVRGTVPKGSYGRDTDLYFCCRNDSSSHTPILLPIDKPFYLLRHTNDCQKVIGMTVEEEFFHFDDEDSNNKDSCSGNHPYAYCGPDINLFFCYYRAKSVSPPDIFG